MLLLFLPILITSCDRISDIDYNRWLEKNEDEIIEEVMKIPDKDINLRCIILILTKQYYPDIDIKKYLGVIDEMAREIKTRVGENKNPEKVIQETNYYLYEVKNFKSVPGTSKEIYENRDEESLLNKVLDNKIGNCFGLSLLYLVIAERLELPIYGVLSPRHFFVRYDDTKYKRNIEPTYNGVEFSEEHYLAPYIDEKKYYTKLVKEDVKYLGYFKNLSKKDVIEALLKLRGTLYYLRGDRSKANNDWGKAIKLSSNPAVTRFKIANLLASSRHTKDENCDKALMHLNKVIEMLPDYYYLYELKGLIRRGRNELEDALLCYSKAIELNPNLSRLYDGRGFIYEKKKQYDEALLDYDKAIELEPEYDLCHYGKAKVLFNKNNYDKALKEFETVIKLNSKYSEAYYFRGLIYKKLGKKQEAIKDFNYYLELEPKSTRTELIQQYIEECDR